MMAPRTLDEVQRKAAGILSVEKDENTDTSLIKALKVRDGSPLDVPIKNLAGAGRRPTRILRRKRSEGERQR